MVPISHASRAHGEKYPATAESFWRGSSFCLIAAVCNLDRCPGRLSEISRASDKVREDVFAIVPVVAAADKSYLFALAA